MRASKRARYHRHGLEAPLVVGLPSDSDMDASSSSSTIMCWQSYDEPSWQTPTPTITSPRSQTLNRIKFRLTVAGGSGRYPLQDLRSALRRLRPDVKPITVRTAPRGWAPPEQIAQALRAGTAGSWGIWATR